MCTMKVAIIENIEMKLFASFGSPLQCCTNEKDTKLVLNQKLPEVPCKDKKSEAAFVKQGGKDVPATINVEEDSSPAVDDIDVPEAIEIEMEILQPYKEEVMEEIMGVTSGDPSVLSPEPERISLTWTPRQCKAKKPTWRRLGMKTTGLVVKDVICLPYKTYLKRNDLYYVPNNRERDMLASLGLVARITIDSCWLSEEMEGRLASLFKHRFCRSHAEKFQFTYLQGSGVLFEPSMPGTCWTAQEVLRICQNGCLYILCPNTLVDDTTNKCSDPLQAC